MRQVDQKFSAAYFDVDVSDSSTPNDCDVKRLSVAFQNFLNVVRWRHLRAVDVRDDVTCEQNKCLRF